MSLGRDMWGPHQHMAHTRGWEYTHEQDEAVAAAAVTGGATDALGLREKGSRRLKRRESDRGKSRAEKLAEVEADGDTRPGSRNERRRDRIRDAERQRSEKESRPSAMDEENEISEVKELNEKI